jgi:hypothetical protein
MPLDICGMETCAHFLETLVDYLPALMATEAIETLQARRNEENILSIQRAQ